MFPYLSFSWNSNALCPLLGLCFSDFFVNQHIVIIHCTIFLREGKQTVLFTFTDLKGLFSVIQFFSMVSWPKETHQRVSVFCNTVFTWENIFSVSASHVSAESLSGCLPLLCIWYSPSPDIPMLNQSFSLNYIPSLF